jgi:hypothetical protein
MLVYTLSMFGGRRFKREFRVVLLADIGWLK